MDATDAADAADTAVPEGCMPSAEVCNSQDDDCDGRSDEDFDTSTDPLNCGACGAACDPAPAHGAAQCVAGACQPLCDDGFDDCNGDPADGCEASLVDATSCGGCDVRCMGTTPLCQDLSGGPTCVRTCGMGTSMCGASCVDTRRDVSNCGDCGAVCADQDHAAATCAMGSCDFVCDTGWDDCDGDPANGCETSLDDPANCGACANDCDRPNAVAFCASRTCGLVCQLGFGDCDSAEANGCEVPLDSLTDCAACGVSCAPASGTGDCSSGACAIAACDPGRDDCNADPSDGCEVDLDTDATSCGGCGVMCGVGQLCSGGSCFDDCGGVPCAGDCTPTSPCTCASGTCPFTCAAADCEASCSGSGTSCTLAGETSSTLDGTCAAGANCTFLARFSSSVTAECSGAGTVCVVDCRNTTSCVVDCHSGAECRIRCNGSSSCGYARCEGGETICGGNEYCNRGC